MATEEWERPDRAGDGPPAGGHGWVVRQRDGYGVVGCGLWLGLGGKQGGW
jgi:hypothetical protein